METIKNNLLKITGLGVGFQLIFGLLANIELYNELYYDIADFNYMLISLLLFTYVKSEIHKSVLIGLFFFFFMSFIYDLSRHYTDLVDSMIYRYLTYWTGLFFGSLRYYLVKKCYI